MEIFSAYHLYLIQKKRKIVPDSYRYWKNAITTKDALEAALLRKNRRAAKEMLDRRNMITKEQAIRYAPLTLGWAPDLLKHILELSPPEPILYAELHVDNKYFLANRIVCTGSLPFIASAVNDLKALEYLLSIGYPTDFNYQRDREIIYRDYLLSHDNRTAISAIPINTLKRHRNFSSAKHADPLAAAICGGSLRCALRLMDEPTVQLTDSVRLALANHADLHITKDTSSFYLEKNIKATIKAVIERLGQGKPLSALLKPEDFLIENIVSNDESYISLYAEVIRQHPDLSFSQISALVHNIPTQNQQKTNEFIKIFPLLDHEKLSYAVTKALSLYYSNNDTKELFDIIQNHKFFLDRCAVYPYIPFDKLLQLLDIFPEIGPAPDYGLSGLAESILRQIREKNLNPFHSALKNTIQNILKSENFEALTAYLEEADIQNTSPETSCLIYGIMDNRKENSYEL